jgi:hypothetical protein
MDNNKKNNPYDETAIPMGLDLNNFLPQNNQNIPNKISESNDIPVIEEVQKQNPSFKSIIENRIRNLGTVSNVWKGGRNRTEAFQAANSLKDLGVINDVFNYFFIKTELHKIDVRTDDIINIFPMILQMISSKYDIYFKNGILSAWKILKLYYDIIVNTKQAQLMNPGGIDLNREDKIKKYNIIINYFQQIKRIEAITNHLKGKPIEGLDLIQFMSELDYFLRKCEGN